MLMLNLLIGAGLQVIVMHARYSHTLNNYSRLSNMNEEITIVESVR